MGAARAQVLTLDCSNSGSTDIKTGMVLMGLAWPLLNDKQIPEVFHICAEELWTINGFWETKSQFSLMVWSLVGGLCSSGWLHTQKCMDCTNWILGLYKMGWGHKIRGSRKVGWLWEKLGGRVCVRNVIKIHCRKFSRNQQKYYSKKIPGTPQPRGGTCKTC